MLPNLNKFTRKQNLISQRNHSIVEISAIVQRGSVVASIYQRTKSIFQNVVPLWFFILKEKVLSKLFRIRAKKVENFRQLSNEQNLRPLGHVGDWAHDDPGKQDPLRGRLLCLC